MEKIRDYIKQHNEILSYLFFGVLTSLISWGSYTLFVYFLKKHVDTIFILDFELSITVLLANSLSWLLATIFAFITNKIYVFKSNIWKPSTVFTELAKFMSTRLVMGIIEVVSVPVLVGLGINQSWFGIDGILAKLLVSIVGVLVNYLISKFMIFNKTAS